MCAMASSTPVDHAHGDDRIQIFGVPVLFGRRAHPLVDLLHGVIAAHLAAGRQQILDQRRQVRRDAGPVHQQRLGGAADAGAPQLGVEHDGARHGQVGVPVHVDMAVAFEVADHRHARFLLDARHQALAAARHDAHRCIRSCPPASGRPPRDPWSAPAGCRPRADRGLQARLPGRHEWRGWSARSPSRRAGSPHCRTSGTARLHPPSHSDGFHR